LSAGSFFSKGDFVTEPRDLSDLVPADVRVELAAVVAALELHGPAVTKHCGGSTGRPPRRGTP
jgi:hypothetical protein